MGRSDRYFDRFRGGGVKGVMSWMVKRIQEDDFGCEERPDDAKAQVLVTLADENGQERMIRVDDEWLYENGIDEGSCWPKAGPPC